MNQIVKVSRGVVVGIGKVKIPKTREMDQEIQLLSFLNIQESETSFISTCIHLHIDGYGKTIEDAEVDMVENIFYFLCKNFQIQAMEHAWENLLDLFTADDWSNELWNAYHKVQVLLSMQGKSTDNIAGLMDRLNKLAERVKEFEAKIQNTELKEEHTELAGDIIKFAKDLLIVERTAVNYKVAA
ncbi:MAG: hypothetical protein FWB83_08280 [Treponema sp.]|nr:hypothetical protein [Treponema sp.]